MNKSLRNILIVDDDRSILSLIQQALKKECDERLNVIATTDSNQALGICRSVSIDLLITDLDMPELNGFGLLKLVKELNPIAHVIILTAYPSANAIRSAFSLGATEYLLKPIDFPLLASTIDFYLSRIDRYCREIIAIPGFSDVTSCVSSK